MLQIASIRYRTHSPKITCVKLHKRDNIYNLGFVDIEEQN